MNLLQMQQRFQMIVRIDMKACWLLEVNCVVCVVIITSLYLGWLILVSLLPTNLLALASILVLLSGALGVVLSRKNSATTSQEK